VGLLSKEMIEGEKGNNMDKKLLKQYKSTFHFGASVRYEKILTRGYEKEESDFKYGLLKCKKVWKQKQVITRTGIVIGWRWLSNGTNHYDSEDGHCYTATESLFAIEVKRGMMNKVDLVLPESLSLYVRFYDPTCQPVPKPFTIPDRIPTMSDKYKQRLSNEMKSVPRDSKGRWKF